MTTFTKGELFCGPGGLALGAQRAGFKDSNNNEYNIKHVWANDIDYSTCKTFVHNICNIKSELVDDYICADEEELKNGKLVLCKDVREIDIEKLPPIDAFTFGFPCNDYSNVGEKKGINGNYGPLYTYGVKVLNTHNPKWFLAENVGGLQSADDGETFKKIIEELSSAGKFGGYDLTTHLYKFEEYGVPQMRHRIIIVGIRKDIAIKENLTFRVPAPITPNPEDYKTARWALEHGESGIPVTQNKEFYNNEMTRHPSTTVERLKCIPPGQNAWYEGIPEELRLNVKGAKLSNIYKRLDPNKPSYTVTGSGGGGTHMYHYDEPRALTNRERARIQTFPDDYEFLGNKENVRKQIGMAVPPEGAKIIIEAILKTFAKIEYDYIEPRWSIDELRDTD